MMYPYTEEASERIEDLVAEDAALMWADLDLMGKETDAQKWNAKLNSIAREYLLSSRFALMRILRERGAMPDALRELTMEHAANMTAQEHMACLEALTEMAGPSPREDPDLHQQTIARAWHDTESAKAVMAHNLPEAVTANPKKRKTRLGQIEKSCKKLYGNGLTREEALRLGHILKFSLVEIQWYLVRVFDTEDGLRMNRSNDLIEAYCFLTGGTCSQAEALKARYQELSAAIPKSQYADRSRNWTRQITGGLLESVETWKLRPETMEENFLTWLVQRASGLDLPSRTALRIYRNLAAYAYGGALPDEEDLLDDLLHISDMDEESEDALEYLFRDGQVSKELCTQVAEHLYLANNDISDSLQKDNTKAWSVITTRKDRELSVSYGAINSSRTRIQSLLLGTEEVEKGDLLYLLWFTFNFVWNSSDSSDESVLYNRIFDLKDAAAALLDNALLPPFYLPHLMEQSMLLSIIYAGKTGTDPSAVYGSVLQSLRESRNRQSGAQKHTLQEQIDIITHYRTAEPGMTLKECSLLYGVSEQSISRWQKELIEAGHIPASL